MTEMNMDSFWTGERDYDIKQNRGRSSLFQGIQSMMTMQTLGYTDLCLLEMADVMVMWECDQLFLHFLNAILWNDEPIQQCG